ncbi:MAG: UPF0182 family protein [Acidimicrobiales bacterium]|nr:UPF0182 family protein [Acidimicrobiales bacterium]
MRAADDLPRREPGAGSGRGRVIAVVAVIVLIVLATSLSGLAGFYTDYLWFESLGQSAVWRRVLGAKVVLTLIFGGIFFVFMWLNLFLTDRAAPTFRPAGPEEELLARYHDVVAGRKGLVRTGVSLLFALIAAAGVSSEWETWLLFTNRQDFGIEDPQFGQDIGFYVFQLPFLTFVVSWAFAAFVIIFILTAVSHYLNGSIRITAVAGSRATPNVKVHLSAILAVLALIKAADYWLDRYQLTLSDRGVVDGALYTDVNAQLPAIYLLIAISLSAVVLLVINLRLRGWTMPVLAVGLWAFTAIVVGGIYPAFVQRFQVEPNETTREAEFVARNIEATNFAFGLDTIQPVDFTYTEELTAEQLREHGDAVANARLLDPVAVHPTFEREQAEREFYRFVGEELFDPGRRAGADPQLYLDTDRYEIDGELRQVVVGARELDLGGGLSWERQHVRLTHGYGIAMATADSTTSSGSPDFVVAGLPTTSDESIDIEIENPQIYHGEDLGGYALVATTVDEIDYVDSVTGTDVPYLYTGTGGVEMSSFLRKAAFALRFREIDPLISNFVDDGTRIIYNRDVHNRVEALAPFLDFDADAYPVLVDGRIFYVIDGYTTSDRFPYSESSDNGRLRDGGLAGADFNYVRNSVKAVVDAYDGTVSFYVMPIDDPIIRAWQGAFPNLFSDFEEMPEALRDHLRYPQDLFRVQTNMYARYQVNDPEALIIGTEAWAVSQDPGRSVRAGGTAETSVDDLGVETTREQRVNPYYTLMQLPGEEEDSFVTLRTFVPSSDDDTRKELEAFIVGETTADGRSRLVSYEMNSASVPGPVLVATSIGQNDEISALLTLLDANGSAVEFSDVLLIPIDDAILWVRSLYVAAEGTSVPTLESVIVSVGEGEQLAIGKTFREALENLFPGEQFDDLVAVPAGGELAPIIDPPPTNGDGDPPPDDGLPDTEAELLIEIDREFRAADEALAEDPPDRVAWAEAQDRIAELLDHFRSLNEPPEPVDPGEVDS